MRDQTVPPHWAELVRNSTELATDEDYDLAKTWFQTVDDPTEAAPLDANIITQDDEEHPANKGASDRVNEGVGTAAPEEAGIAATEGDPNNPFNPLCVDNNDSAQPWTSQGSEGENNNSMPTMVNLEKSGLRRSPRIASMRTALSTIIGGALLIAAFFTSIPTIDGLQGLTPMQKLSHRYHSVNANFDGTLNGMFNTVFATSDSNDCYTYSGMLKQDDKGKFVKAMLKETAVHEARGHWTVIKRSDMPAAAKTILSIWSFKRKHLPDGTISKYKARLCAHRGMQSWGVDYWETFAPVVNWMSV